MRYWNRIFFYDVKLTIINAKRTFTIIFLIGMMEHAQSDFDGLKTLSLKTLMILSTTSIDIGGILRAGR